MSKVTCNVIKDVLPLYVDGILSDDTSRIVAEHLEQCSECKKTYEDMKSAVVIPVDNDVTPLKNFQKAWKKKIISRVCAAILIAVANYVLRSLYANRHVELNCNLCCTIVGGSSY